MFQILCRCSHAFCYQLFHRLFPKNDLACNNASTPGTLPLLTMNRQLGTPQQLRYHMQDHVYTSLVHLVSSVRADPGGLVHANLFLGGLWRALLALVRWSGEFVESFEITPLPS
jgi:hypothetical protein